jgi:hypothetical protein
MLSAVRRDPYLVTGCTSPIEIESLQPIEIGSQRGADAPTSGALLIGGNFSVQLGEKWLCRAPKVAARHQRNR